MSHPDFPPSDFSPPGEPPHLASNPADERTARLAEFRATLQALTPRVFVAYVLVAINAVVFLLMLALEPKSFLAPSIQLLVDWGANFGPLTLNGQPWRIFTSMFVHTGILHFGLNMVGLAAFGPLMERLVGNLGFLALYVVSGLAGSLASVFWNPELVSCGASGAIFGLLGGLLGVLLLGAKSMPREVFESLRNNALTLLVINLASGFAIKGIDNAAHIGGLVGGCLCGVLLGQPVTLAAGRQRWLRNGLVAVLGVAITAGGLAAIPAPADVDGALRRFGPVEEQVLRRQSELLQKEQAGTLTIDELIRAIETELLPPWIAARQEFEKLQNVPRRLQPLVAAYLQYLRAREEYWRTQLDLVRSQDQTRAAELPLRDAAIGAAVAEIQRISAELRGQNP
ncbi:MAG: rhomboid family intramembrane serine protease [Pirellulaceae bacterium]|nr:rhomboid family intramembrane serine protease [Pirellulaceae bacterium]